MPVRGKRGARRRGRLGRSRIAVAGPLAAGVAGLDALLDAHRGGVRLAMLAVLRFAQARAHRLEVSTGHLDDDVVDLVALEDLALEQLAREMVEHRSILVED